MLYSKNGYYEPLCKVKKIKKGIGIKYNITRFFSIRDFNVFDKNSSIVNIIGNIRKILFENCLAKNSISEAGNHDELINQNGIYKKLWDIQTGKFL